MSLYYKLDENKKVISSSLEEWANFIEGKLPTNYRHVGDDTIGNKRISTVFIGIDYSYSHGKLPIVFETMIFNNSHGIYQERYATWDEAVAGHNKAVEWVKNGFKEDEIK